MKAREFWAGLMLGLVVGLGALIWLHSSDPWMYRTQHGNGMTREIRVHKESGIVEHATRNGWSRD